MSSADHLFQQAISSTQGLRRNPIGQVHPRGIRPAPLRREVFLDLELNASEFDPGGIYDARVTLMPQRKRQGVPSWAAREEGLVLSLSCPGAPDLIIEADVASSDVGDLGPASVRLTWNHLFPQGAEVPFRIEVPHNSPRRQVKLEASCSNPGFPQSLEALLSRDIQILGTEEPWTFQDTTLYKVNLSLPAPADLACLHVSQGQEDWLILQGFSKSRRLLPSQIQKPDISLARFMEEDKKRIREIVARLRAFSNDRIGDLQTWLNDLRKVHTSGLTLIIMDRSDAEIPWELIDLHDHQYIGTIAEVVRWLEMWEHHEQVQLWLQRREARGIAVEYLDTTTPSHYASEGAKLKALKAEHLASLEEVKERLQQGTEDIGLLYLGCHGTFVHPQREAERYQTLFSEDSTQRKLVSLDFEFIPKPKLKIPAIFVNACHSGRIRIDGTIFHGLPKMFLRFTDGYVGTLGLVNQKRASEIGSSVLQALHDTEGVRISEVLRRLRSELVSRLDFFKATDDDLALLLFTFMFVYYGNPWVCLTLGKGMHEEGDHE